MSKMVWVLLAIISAITLTVSIFFIYIHKPPTPPLTPQEIERQRVEKEVRQKQLNFMLLMMYEKKTPLKASQFFYDNQLRADVFDLMRELTKLNIIERKSIKGARTNGVSYELTASAISDLTFMPDRFKGNPYDYFLSKYPDLNTMNNVTATPSRKNSENNKTSWYNSSLFTNFIFPLLVGIIILAIAIFLKRYYNLG